MGRSARIQKGHGEDLNTNMLSPLERGMYNLQHGGREETAGPVSRGAEPRADVGVPQSQQVASSEAGFNVYRERQGGRRGTHGRRRNEM